MLLKQQQKQTLLLFSDLREKSPKATHDAKDDEGALSQTSNTSWPLERAYSISEWKRFKGSQRNWQIVIKSWNFKAKCITVEYIWHNNNVRTPLSTLVIRIMTDEFVLKENNNISSCLEPYFSQNYDCKNWHQIQKSIVIKVNASTDNASEERRKNVKTRLQP